jgi:peroxiredoxin Q/BCP
VSAAPAPGDAAPDFALPATGGGEWRLASRRGRVVVLVFYPGDDTPVCTRQLCAYNDELAQFRALDAEVVGISAQGLDSHERFADRHGFGFPLLADEDKRVARAYGILGPFGLPRRSVFVVDAAGRITYAHRALAGLTYRPVAELVAAIADARGVQR